MRLQTRVPGHRYRDHHHESFDRHSWLGQGLILVVSTDANGNLLLFLNPRTGDGCGVGRAVGCGEGNAVQLHQQVIMVQ